MCVPVTVERVKDSDAYQSNLFFRLIRQDERDPLMGYDDERMQDQNQRSHQSPYLGAGYSGLDICRVWNVFVEQIAVLADTIHHLLIASIPKWW